MRLENLISIICLLLISVYSATSQDPYADERSLHHQQRHHAKRVPQQQQQRVVPRRDMKRVYAMCPPTFVKIGNECYHMSDSEASWLDAHFECKDKNAKLAEPMKSADRALRKFMIERGRTRGMVWIGGMYNWQRFKWQWGYNGKEMTYQSFSRMAPGEDLKYSCAVLNPELKYRWSAKKCFEKHYYLCQHPMPFVGDRARQRVYTKWNETYPGQLANEVQVFVATNGTNRREYYRATATPRRHNSPAEHAGNHRNIISNEINPPEVRDATARSKLRRNKKQQQQRMENKALLRSKVVLDRIDFGELGKHTKIVKQRHGKRVQQSTSTSTPTDPPTTSDISTPSEHPNYINRLFHAHRHNHQTPERVETPPATTSDAATTSTSSTSTATSTSSAVVTTSSISSDMAAKQLEKKRKIEKIRAKLSKLTDEEKLEFLRMKAELKKRKESSTISNDVIPEV